MTLIMVTQMRLSIGSIAFVSAFQVSIFCLVGSAGTAHAADCLTAPGAAAPNSHWHYRTDRAQQRKCWFLQPDGAAQEDVPATTQSVPAAAPNSLASFKAFIAQRGMTNLSDKDVEQLYGEFLEWRRRPENEAINTNR